MSIDSILVIAEGNFLEAVKQVDPLTIQHARDIQKDRWTDSDLRDYSLWTGDFPLYIVDNNEVFLCLADVENNLILKNLENAFEQIKHNKNYFPKLAEIGQVIDSKSTLKIKLSELNLTDRSISDSMYFEVYTASKKDDNKNNYELLNPTQRALAEKINGFGDDFIKTMKTMNEYGIVKFQIDVIDPEYVIEHSDPRTKSLARGTSLSEWSLLTPMFPTKMCLSEEELNWHGGYLRGKLPTREKSLMDEYDNALKLLISNPKETRLHFQKDTNYFIQMRDIINDYLNRPLEK